MEWLASLIRYLIIDLLKDLFSWGIGLIKKKESDEIRDKEQAQDHKEMKEATTEEEEKNAFQKFLSKFK